jgi:hypothetical protein
MYIYKVYELNIHADFPIHEFPIGDGTGTPADVIIRHGLVSAALENPTGRGVLYQATSNQFLLDMHDVARYLVQNGNEIIIEPAVSSLESDVRVFLLSSCIGALLHQRGMLVIHAAAVVTGQGAVLFAGSSGNGKSTLLGEFLRRGYKMMVDDVCAVVLDSEGVPLVLPGYPRIRLWRDAAIKLEKDVTSAERTRPSLEKFEWQISELYCNQPVRLLRIYLLTTVNKNKLELIPMPRINTFSIVLDNTYQQQFLDGLEMRASHFNLVTAVARQTRVTRVTRPNHSFQLTELADLIEHDLAQG